MKPMRQVEPLETIWEIPDDLWEKVEPVILEGTPPKTTGRKRVNPRPILNGIIFRLRSGCQWNHLPKTFGDDSTIHRTFQLWVESGVLNQVWSVMVEECEELEVWTGNGKQRIAPWVKLAWGGRNWPQSHGPGQGGQQAKPVGRGGWRASESSGSWSQCPRHQAAGSHPGSHCGGAASAH